MSAAILPPPVRLQDLRDGDQDLYAYQWFSAYQWACVHASSPANLPPILAYFTVTVKVGVNRPHWFETIASDTTVEFWVECPDNNPETRAAWAEAYEGLTLLARRAEGHVVTDGAFQVDPVTGDKVLYVRNSNKDKPFTIGGVNHAITDMSEMPQDVPLHLKLSIELIGVMGDIRLMCLKIVSLSVN